MLRTEERAVAIPLGDGQLALEGLFVTGSEGAGGAVVAAPHPLYGGSMESPVVNEIAYAFGKGGGATLRFNWRGVGASAGAPSGELRDAEADYHAALEQLEQTVAGPLAACGYSFGAAAALRVSRTHPRLRRLVLVAPPPALVEAPDLESFGGGVLVVAGERDSIAPPSALHALAASAARSEFEVVPEADHFFMAGLADLGRAVAGWLAAA